MFFRFFLVQNISNDHKEKLEEKKNKGLSSLTVRLAGPGPGAVLAGGLFAVSRLSWQWSMVAEVFTLNNLFVGLLFFLTASFHCAENATQRGKVTQ